MQAATGGHVVEHQGTELDLGAPFAKATVEALLAEAGLALDLGAIGGDVEAARSAALEALDQHGGSDSAQAAVREACSVGQVVDAAFDALVAPKLQQPTFVTGWPADSTPLAAALPGARHVADRFQLFVAEHEVAEVYAIQTDADAASAQMGGSCSAERNPEAYLKRLAHLPADSALVGLGVDRLLMLLTDSKEIAQVLPWRP